ncbi:glycine betaine ABC transporter substrate-binding protein [Pendulispora albinea]|uniref:ABC transporter permease subunit n=1 Tax=Pendulispora albinea TaxID=2741071 RepID=A0ABZ2MCK0_9BACT
MLHHLRHVRAALALLAAALLATFTLPARAEPVLHVGSKRFTESYVLAEIVRTAAEKAGEARAEHHQGLGNTGIVFAALKSGSIDVYAEYTGTIARELLGHVTDAPTDLEAINRELAPLGLTAGIPLGFNDTYALAMRSETAKKHGLTTLSELAPRAELRFGFSQEFLERADGWAALVTTYGMKAQRPRAIEHALAYKALVNGDIDVVDVYSTDPKIEEEHLTVLTDDKHLFPRYDAVLLYRSDLPGRLPKTWAALQRLKGTIDEARMTRMNADAEVRGLSFDAIARAFLDGSGDGGRATGQRAAVRPSFFERLFGGDFLRLTGEHLFLVAISVALGTLVGVPLGIWAAYRRGATQPILGAVGILQTIPSLALLAFLIPILHRIGILPAMVALFLYSLLPIVRNTYTGLSDIAPSLRESALALGLPRGARLRLVELPLASRAIVGGVKTSAVISVGTATIAAFIGAGGYGERIASGLALSDNDLLLAGAIPAAGMALLFEAFFGVVERWIIPRPLRA